MLGELCQPTGAGPELFHKFMMNASAEMAKSNRRKQSKPNRLLAEEGNGANPKLNIESALQSLSASPMQTKNEAELMETDRTEKDPMDLSTRAVDSPADSATVDVVSPQNNKRDTPSGELEMINFPCHTCGEMFTSRAKQEQHISDRHSSNEMPKMNHSSPGTVFPTAYHQLAKELGLGPLPTGLMPPSTKAADRSKVSNGLVSSSNAMPSLGTPGVGGKGSSGTVFQREAYCELCQREFCNKYFLKTHKANIHGIVDPSDPKCAAVMAKANQSAKPTTSPSLEPVQQQMQRLPQQQHAAPPKPSSNESMDDFCEICQKHFCNKYYLKKHKVDVHNIRPDGSKSSSGMSNDSGMESRSMPHMPSVSSAPMQSLPMMIPPLSSMNPTSMNNMLFVNPFVPSMAAMSMVPPMMQPPFFMPGMPNLAAAQVLSNISPPQIKNESKVARPPSNLERGESLPDSDVKAEGFCDICRKVFCNSYFLQVHRANKHGIFDEATASAAFMMSMAGAGDQKEPIEGMITKNSASPASSTNSNTVRPVVLKTDKDRLQTSPAFSLNSSQYDSLAQPMVPPALSFDAMLAAKQADRIMCDICNKEVCNKYFLKAHKLKMHGITSPPEDRRTTPTKEVKRESSNVQPPLPMLTMPQQPPLPTLQPMGNQQFLQSQPPSADSNADPSDLMKLGIDPEAYCFLCKKAFCSKYFLKTHKLNMHGVKADTDLSHRVTPKGTITPPTSVSPVSATSPAQAVPVVPGSETFQWRWKENRSKVKANTFSPVNANTFSPVNENANVTGNSDQFTWRWKEPANATRVFCDICNKELCNKYFLRTHKLKKHGICDSNEQGMQASSMMVDLARVSQASLQNKPKGSADMNGFDRRISVNNTISQSSSPTEMDQQATLRDDVCQVCGMVFPDLIAVEEHIRAEHGDELFETPKSAATEEKECEKAYNCNQCSYKTSVWQKMVSHETRKHNPEINTCRSCNITFSHVQMLIKHMRDIHNEDITAASLEVASQRRNGNGAIKPTRLPRNRIANRMKLAGNSINGRFPRRNHKNLGTLRVYACDKCNYTCNTMRTLRFHQAMKHKSKNTLNTIRGQSNGTLSASVSNPIMQDFVIDSLAGTDSIVKETVTLPVYERIDADVRISLTLTPSRVSNLADAC